MNPSNKQILDSLEHFHTTFVKVQTIQGLTHQNKADLLRVMQQEFRPGYTYDMWCPHCAGKFLQDVYREYNKWKAANVEPVQDAKKITVKATFPKNKMQ